MKNKEFLFIYDAAMCNPNGDPDQENKPRMDRATRTNLVSDGRLKRYIRDYIIDSRKENDDDVFVRNINGRKLSVEKRLHGVIMNYVKSENSDFNNLVKENPRLKEAFEEASKDLKKQAEYKEFYISKLPKESDSESQAKTKWKDKSISNINNELLVAFVKKNLVDIRFFGGAFAVAGFSNTFTGSVQINWGYSLHPVELIDSNSIVTIMSGNTEGESNIGKKEGLYYSLIGFTGTINAKRAEALNMTDEDVAQFRESMVKSIMENRTDSKKNQYPKLYLEIEYKDEQCYGRLGDLRNLITITSDKPECKNDQDFTGVRSTKDLKINFDNLNKDIDKISKYIHKIRVWKSLDDKFTNFNITGVDLEILDF